MIREVNTSSQENTPSGVGGETDADRALPAGLNEKLATSERSVTKTGFGEAILIADANCRVVYANHGAAELWAMEDPAKMQGTSIHEYWIPRPDADQVLEDMVRIGKWSGDLTGVRKDGSTFLAHCHLTLIRDAEGRPAGAVNSIQGVGDVASRESEGGKYLQKLKRLSEWSVQLCGEPGDIFVKVVGLIGELFEVPISTLCAVEGDTLSFKARYDRGQIRLESGKANWQDLPCGWVITSRALQTCDRVLERFPNSDLLRQLNPYSYCGLPVLDRTGEVRAVVCLLDDKPRHFSCEEIEILRLLGERVGWEIDREASLMAQREAERAMIESERFTRAVIDAMPLHVAVLDAQGVVMLANQSWRDFSMNSIAAWQHAMEGVNYKELCRVAAEDGIQQAKRVQSELEKLLLGTAGQFVVTYPCRCSENPRWFLCRGVRFDADGAVRILIVQSDVTHLKETEKQASELREQLAHAGRVSTMGEMAAGIAHELNQPLAAMNLYAEGCLAAIRNADLPSSDAEEKLREVIRLSDRCGKIISNLRRFVGRNSIGPRETCDLREVIQIVASIVQHEVLTRQGVLKLHLPSDPVWSLIDNVQIQQVILNLVRNALEASGDAGAASITIGLAHVAPHHAEIRVTDKGAGIDSQAINRLFEPYFTTKPSGMGMGLKISQTIVRSHHGNLSCDLSTPGQTTFVVRLPRNTDTNA